jgi:PKD repeat protein
MATDTLVVTVNAAPKPVISGGGIYCRGETVTFDAAGTVDPDGDRLRYVWNFGDGTADVEGSSVNHVYRHSGKFNLNLLVDDQTNVSNGRVQINKAVMINEPPYPDAGVDRLVSPGDRVVFDAAGTVDRDGKVTSFQWDLGDGSRKNGKRVIHRYQASGVYKVTLTVTDDSGTSCAQAQASASVRVNATPKAVIKGDADQLVDAHTTLVFDATGSYDPDNDPLSFSWRFGDGNQAEGPKVAHRYAQPGTYTVTLRVDDGNRLKSSSAKATQSVRVKKRE